VFRRARLRRILPPGAPAAALNSRPPRPDELRRREGREGKHNFPSRPSRLRNVAESPMPWQGLEPRTNGLCLLLRLSPRTGARARTVFVVWTFSSLYASAVKSLHLPRAEAAGLGSGLPSRFRGLGFPEFDRFYKRT
jgi:hypothetical protein